jgi:molybdate transport system substrate-binding protein
LSCSTPDEVLVAAASSMRDPLQEITERFEEDTGHTVRLSLGSSGSFFGQIWNGAPFDVYLAADAEYPRRLDEAGFVEPESLRTYAIGRIVLWSRSEVPIDLEGLGMEALRDPSVNRIAIANPRLAPYGRAAVAAMERFGVWDEVQPKIVTGDSIAQAAQFAASGAADVAIIALSIATREAMSGSGHYWEIPSTAHPPIEQAMVVLGSARERGHYETARAFWEFVSSGTGRSILERYGFSIP